MAVLTNADFQQAKEWIRRNPTAKTELKAWGLSKAVFKAALQEIEDWQTNGFSTTPTESLKAAVETHTGAATNAQVKQLSNVWRYGL